MGSRPDSERGDAAGVVRGVRARESKGSAGGREGGKEGGREGGREGEKGLRPPAQAYLLFLQPPSLWPHSRTAQESDRERLPRYTSIQ